MKTTLQLVFTLMLATLAQSPACGQSDTSGPQDTLKAQRLQIYRQWFAGNLPGPVGGVNDFEGLYTDEEEHILDSMLRAFRLETGMEIVVVTLDSNACAADSFSALTLQLARRWGVGEKGKNNGILIGISRGHRKMRINNAQGITALISDAETKQIIDDHFIPSFRRDEYPAGTMKGVAALMKLLRSKNH